MREKIEKITANCKTFGVVVKMYRHKDKYFLKLSLSSTELRNNDWLDKWGGFRHFADFQIRPFFSHQPCVRSTATSATFMIGKFFDFIKGQNNLAQVTDYT